jgi:ubiquinone/menaquinone biosynthesis C-methylase UbiE
VGCGPGALTGELVRRLGAAQVAGLEASPSFVEACRSQLPEVEIVHGVAEQLPWKDQTFDVALSQLVLSFVTDADQVAREMRRVVREGGVVAACMWHEGDSLPLTRLFWSAVVQVDPQADLSEDRMRFRKQGEIAELWRRNGLRDVEETFLDVRVRYQNFDDFWEPIVTGAGNVGAYMATADAGRRAAIREACRGLLGDPQQAFELSARACAARARV